MRSILAVLVVLLALAAGIAIGIARRGGPPAEPESESRSAAIAERSASGAPARPAGSPVPKRPKRETPARDDVPAEPESAAVFGVVLNRRDRSPVPALDVFLESEAREPGAGGVVEIATVKRVVAAAGDGGFAFESVPAGRYALFAAGPGFAAAAAVTLDLDAGETRRRVVVEVVPAAAVNGTVVDGAGYPVPQATVTAKPLLSLAPRSDSSGERAAAAVTDDAGRFRIEVDPIARACDLVAERAGFLPGFAGDVAVNELEETRGVVIELLRGGIVRGTLTSEDGAPVKGAAVSLGVEGDGGTAFETDAELGRRPAVAARLETRTDAAGDFVFETVPAGRRPLGVEAEGFLPRVRDYVKIEEGVEHAPVAIVLDPGLSIRGRVSDDTGVPVPGANVLATPVRIGAARSASSDESGRFVVPGLEDGSHVLDVAAEGLCPASVARVKAGDENVSVTLRRRATIVGRVRRPDGRPHTERFAVTAARGDSDSADASFTGTDPDGRFSLLSAPSGKAVVRASAAGFGDSAPFPVLVDPGGTSPEIVLDLRELGAITGQVVRAAGGWPIEGAIVRLGTEDEEARPGAVRFFPEITATTGADGAFTLGAVQPGRQAITVRHPDFPERVVKNVDVAPGEPATAVSVRMEEGGGVRGTVLRADGLPEEGARIVLASLALEPDRSAVTDSTGAYEVRGLRAGFHVLLKAASPGSDRPSRIRSFLVKIVKGSTVALDIRESSGGTRVDGTVTDDGRPVAGAIVEAALAREIEAGSRPSGEPDLVRIESVRTDAAGAYAFAALDSAFYTFRIVSNPGARPFLVRAFVPRRDDFGLDFTLPFGGFEGRVVDGATRRPLAGIVVKAYAKDAAASGGGRARREIASAETESDGRFSFERLSPGTYEATAIEAAERGKEPVYREGSVERIAVDEETLTRRVEIALRRR